jgi:hypothetical protein
MLRRSAGRSSGSLMLGVKRREREGVRRLPSPAVASRRWLRSRPRLDPARCRRARRRSAPAEPSLPRTELRRSGSCLRRGNALPTSARILAWTTISLVSIFLTGDTLQGRARGNWLLSRLRWQPRCQPRCLGVKGGAFSAGGEISAATAVKDEAGTMSRRLREASQQLLQQLSQVS